MDALERGLPPPETGGTEEDLSDEQVWLEGEVWWTLFPPPENFDGEEQGELGDPDYQRTLTADEAAAWNVKRRSASDAERARCCAMRDRFFGLEPRGTPGFSFSGEAGLSGPSETLPPPGDPGEGRSDPVEQSSGSDHTPPATRSEGGSGPRPPSPSRRRESLLSTSSAGSP
jgi:hypothetical protein